MNSKPQVSTVETNKTTNSSKTPLPETAPLFSDIWNQAGVAATHIPTEWVAPTNTMQTGAISQLAGVAPTLGANAGSLRDVAGKVANGYFLDPTNDPTFAGAAQAAINPITRTLQEKILPGVVDTSIRNGGVGGGPAAYGGARQDIQENQAIQDWSQTAGDITSKMAADSRAQGMKLIPTAGTLDSAATGAALTPANTLGAAGTQQQAYDQQSLDNTIKTWMAALSGAQQGANVLTTGGFGNNSSTEKGLTTNTGPAPDMATQWLQGITGGAGMLNSVAGLPGMSSLGSGIGSIFGTTAAPFGVGAGAGEMASLLAALGPMAAV
jgi:hypothetical protein